MDNRAKAYETLKQVIDTYRDYYSIIESQNDDEEFEKLLKSFNKNNYTNFEDYEDFEDAGLGTHRCSSRIS